MRGGEAGGCGGGWIRGMRRGGITRTRKEKSEKKKEKNKENEKDAGEEKREERMRCCSPVRSAFLQLHLPFPPVRACVAASREVSSNALAIFGELGENSRSSSRAPAASAGSLR
eukprot:1972074-Pyramimonas_sp.AAC.1